MAQGAVVALPGYLDSYPSSLYITGMTSSVGASPLGKLIVKRMAELQLTYEEFEKRSSLSHSTVFSVVSRTEFRQLPRPETLAKLAKGLGLPLETIRDAAARSCGFMDRPMVNVDAAEDLAVITQILNDMEPAQRAMLRRVAIAMNVG